MLTKDLQQLQQDFQNYLLNQDSQIITSIVGDTENPAPVRLNIYQDAYFLRLIAALRQDYPTVAELMGHELFDTVATQYIRMHPSPYFSLRWFGEKFPAFLKNTADKLAAFWAELAVFELALTTAFDAPNDPVILPVQLQDIPPEKWADITFRFHSSFQLIQLNWNVVAAWKAKRSAKLRKFHPKQYQKQSTWMVWRQELETYFVKLKIGEATLLQAAKIGQSFGVICESLGQCGSGNKWIMHVAGLLQSWIQRGLITAIEIN